MWLGPRECGSLYIETHDFSLSIDLPARNKTSAGSVIPTSGMRSSKLYISAIIFGLIGAAGGAFAGGIIAAAKCEGGLECLGEAFIGMGLGAIAMESCAMAFGVHKVNQNRGNLLQTFLPTLALAVPIPFAMLPGFTAPLATMLFLLQAWACVKVQLATSSGRRPAVRAGSRSR